MDLLLIQNSSEERADEALLAALNQHRGMRVHACRDLHKVRGLIAAHAPSAVILRPGPQLRATLAELKSQASSLLCFILLEASAYEPLADLLQDEDLVPLPLEYVHTSYFPELVRQAVAQAITPALVNAHLHEEMRQAYEQLQHLDAMKSQFIQNVSHELRTPLSIVKGYVDLALGDVLGFDLTGEQQEALDAIRTHTARVIDIVESITTLEGLEQDHLRQLSTSPQSIRPICLTAIQANKQKAMRADVQIIADLPEALPQVEVDARHMVQALGHLLDNAIKFNSKHGKIWMQAAQHEDEVWVQIKDTGIGIPRMELEQIFNRFYQVDGAINRQYGGMGLGLSIVKEIIDKHHGRIWAESNTDNQGATFTLALPIIPALEEENVTEAGV